MNDITLTIVCTKERTTLRAVVELQPGHRLAEITDDRLYPIAPAVAAQLAHAAFAASRRGRTVDEVTQHMWEALTFLW